MAKLSEAFTRERIFDFQDFTQQDPAGLGLSNAIVVTWGAGGTSSDGSFSMSSAGIGEVLKNDVELSLVGNLRVGRTSGASISKVLMWIETSIDNELTWVSNTGVTVSIHYSGADIASNALGTLIIPKGSLIGSKFRVRFGREDSSNNSGSIIPALVTGSFTAVTDLVGAASARLVGNRIIGE